MTITYPLSLPTVKGPAEIHIAARSVVGISESPFTLSQQVQEWAGQAWGATVTLPPMGRDDAEEWICFLLALNGRSGTFLMGSPEAKTPRGVATGLPRVNGAGQLGNVLLTKDWTPETTNILKKGDWIQIGETDNARLHKLLLPADSDIDGLASLTLWPNLKYSPVDNLIIYTNNTVGLWRLDSNITEWDIKAMPTYGLSFACVEAQ